MNIEELKKAGINYEDGIKRFAYKAEIYNKYLINFFDDPTFFQLGDYLKEQNYIEAFKCAHTLKGVSGNLSMDDFYQCVCILVEALRNNQTDNINQIYNNLLIIYKKAEKTIKQFEN
ncbi:MAG: hypothetical protein RSE07_06095 [Oscillospiraceae bacterium]